MNMVIDLELKRRDNYPVGYLLRGEVVINDQIKHFVCNIPRVGNSVEGLVDSFRDLADYFDAELKGAD